jgi:hypothetical protein
MALANWIICQYNPQKVRGNVLGVASGPTQNNSVTVYDIEDYQKIRSSPFNSTVFFRTEWMAWSGITVLLPFNTGGTLTSSHWMPDA